MFITISHASGAAIHMIMFMKTWFLVESVMETIHGKANDDTSAFSDRLFLIVLEANKSLSMPANFCPKFLRLVLKASVAESLTRQHRPSDQVSLLGDMRDDFGSLSAISVLCNVTVRYYPLLEMTHVPYVAIEVTFR